MQTAFDVIKDTYDYEQCTEIVNHGCQSGVCSQHIYYADTVRFFEQHAEEITRELVDNFGTEFLAQVLTSNGGSIDHYMNDLTWTFIELAAMRIVDEYEDTTQEYESEQGYNPAQSMTDMRYALS